MAADEGRSGSDLERVESRLGSLSTRSDAADAKQAGLEDALVSLRESGQSSAAELAKATQRLDGLEVAFRAEVGKVSNDLLSFEQTMKADWGNDTQKLASMGDRVQAMEASVKEKLAEFEIQVTELREELKDALRSVLRGVAPTPLE